MRTQAQILRALSSVSISLSDLDNAERQIRAAVDVLKSSPHAKSRAMAETYQTASGLLYQREKLAEAGAMGRNAVAVYEHLGLGLSTSWYARLNVLRAQRDADERAGCENLERFLITVRADTALAIDALAGVLKETASCRPNTTEGLRQNETELLEAIDLVGKNLGATNFRVMQLKHRLARVMLAQFRLDAAKRLLDEILPEQIRVYGEDSWAVAYTRQELGKVATERGDYVEGHRLLMQSHAVLSRMDRGGPNRDFARSAFALARAKDLAHLDDPAARALYVTALERMRESRGPKADEVGTYSVSYAGMLLRLGERAEAETLLETAVTILPANVSDGARARVALAQILADPNEDSRALALLQDAEVEIAHLVAIDTAFGDAVSRLRVRLGRSKSATRD